jgi:transcriptional regulator with XRE-family HTH domain
VKQGELWKGVAHKELVDAQPAMDHIRGLAAKGMLLLDMAEDSGLNERTIRGFFNGYVQTKGHRRPTSRCLPETLRIVLAIKFRTGWTGEGFRPDLMRGLRESKGFSRHALASAAGICPETIQYWETGRSLPKYKKKLDAVLLLLGATWEDVSGPVVTEQAAEDEYSVIFSEGLLGVDADYTPEYPCHVCGAPFRSLLTLRTHPHPKKKVSA